MKVETSIKSFLRSLKYIPVEKAVLIKSDHGMGKSSVVKQHARSRSVPYIDFRLGQTTEGDLLGLPKITENGTKFYPPELIIQACKEPCDLHFDEMNRGSPEVMQAVFQIVLDREIAGWKLHPGTKVFASINESTVYNVSEIDPALLDRFWVVNLRPTVEEWIDYAREMSFSELVTGFISRNPAMLDPPRVYNPSSIQPSRRTWEDLSKSIGLMGNDINSVLLYEVAVGYVGSEVAVSFNDYVRTVSSALTAEDVVKSRVTDPDVYRQLSASEQNALIEEVARVIRGEKSLPKIAETGMRAFFLSLPGELRVSLWSKLVSGGLAEEKLILDVHRVCSKYVTEVFSTPKE